MDLRGLFDGLYDKLVLRDLFGKVVPGSAFLLYAFSALLGIDTVDRFLNKMTVVLWVIAIGFAWLLAFALQFLGESCGMLRTHPSIHQKQEEPKDGTGFSKVCRWLVRVFGASFKITEQSLKSLKTEGVPDDVLEKLQGIKNQKVRNEERFLDLLKTTIGDDRTVTFKSSIMKHAVFGTFFRKFQGLKEPKTSDEQKARDEFYGEWASFHELAEPHERVYAERLSVIKEACGNGAVSITLITIGLVFSLIERWMGGKEELYPLWLFTVLATVLAISLRQMHIKHVERYGHFVKKTKKFREEIVSREKDVPEKEKSEALGENT